MAPAGGLGGTQPVASPNVSPMSLLDVRSSAAEIAAHARWVRIDEHAIHGERLLRAIAAPNPDGRSPDHRSRVPLPRQGEPAHVADYLLALDAINFGSDGSPRCASVWPMGRPRIQ